MNLCEFVWIILLSWRQDGVNMTYFFDFCKWKLILIFIPVKKNPPGCNRNTSLDDCTCKLVRMFCKRFCLSWSSSPLISLSVGAAKTLSSPHSRFSASSGKSVSKSESTYYSDPAATRLPLCPECLVFFMLFREFNPWYVWINTRAAHFLRWVFS